MASARTSIVLPGTVRAAGSGDDRKGAWPRPPCPSRVPRTDGFTDDHRPGSCVPCDLGW